MANLTDFCGPHKTTYEAYFNDADTNKTAIIGALDAAAYLKKSGLSAKVLGQIWEVSDPKGKGYLDKQGFFISLKLISVAQSGLDVSMSNVTKECLPPNLGPIPVDSLQGVGSIDSDWDIPVSERVKYQQIFNDLVPVNGLLSGDKVKPVLLNSKLPVDVLGCVWDLSDYDKDGMLDQDEFAVAMHLVYRALEKDPVPPALPYKLIPPSKRKKIQNAVCFTGIGGTGPVSPTTWIISPVEKQKFDEMFKVADTDKDGFVNGTEIKETFLQSGLPQNTLAHIWTLCDTKLMGKLNSEEFALAMYLIQQKLKGIEPPEKLSPEMMPPSMRLQTVEGISGPVTDLSTAGMKELDMIQKEIDEIKSEKMQLEQERAQIEADIKIRNGEVQGLQKELDVINGTVTKLENQKAEAQKRLDELDDRKNKIHSKIEDIKEKCNEENDQMLKLQHMINNTESTVKDQEEELKQIRDELNILRKEELELEQQVEGGRTQLDQLTTNISKTNGKFSQGNIQRNRTNSVNATVQQDPFSDEDPFSNEDPFKGTDPFKSTEPFSGGPFGGNDIPKSQVNAKAVAFGAGDKPSTFGNNASFKPDPFEGNSFGGAFANAKSDINDPFAPFGGAGQISSPVDPKDPFGTDPFNPDSSSKKNKIPPPRPSKSPVPPSKSPAPPVPSLPPKQKKAPPPPRPPAPRPSSTKPEDDPFSGFDPFGNSSSSASGTLNVGDGLGGFADFSPSKFTSNGSNEDDQLAWATRSSHDEWERQKKLQEQEQADLELAIKLSQQESSQA